jgi:hypothetical protein
MRRLEERKRKRKKYYFKMKRLVAIESSLKSISSTRWTPLVFLFEHIFLIKADLPQNLGPSMAILNNTFLL